MAEYDKRGKENTDRRITRLDKVMEISSFGEIYKVHMTRTRYASNGNLAIYLHDVNTGDCMAMLTKNLGWRIPKNYAYIDTGSCPWGEDFVRKYNLAVKLDEYGRDGKHAYPLYKFV